MYKLLKWLTREEETADVDLVSFDEQVSDLQVKRDKAMILHQLITDVQLCDGQEHVCKVFTISWNNEATGKSMSYDISIFNEKDTNAIALQKLAETEINNMIPDIERGIEQLSLCRKVLSPTDNMFHNSGSVVEKR